MKIAQSLLIMTCSLLWLNVISFSVSAKEPIATDSKYPQWPTANIANKPSLRASAVVADRLWVGGTNGSIFISDDKGKTWQSRPFSDGFTGDVRDLEVFDKQTAIAMTAGEGKLSRLYLTINGGESWSALLTNDAPKGFYDSISFWDRNNGLLLGDPVDGYYTLLKTQDGGKSWQRIAQQQLPKMLAKEAAFAASGNTILTLTNGKAWLTTGGFSASAWYSDSFGKSWQRKSVPIHQQTQTSGGYAVAVNNIGSIFVMGGDYLQRDGNYPNLAVYSGTTKKAPFTRLKTGNNGLRTAMQCIKNICLLTGKLGTDISYDHGMNWEVFSQQGFYTLAKNDSLFLAAGHDGRVAVLSINLL